MKVVYVLQHVHTFEDGSEDVKFIGVYSSERNAELAKERLTKVQGFREAPDGFAIDECELDEDNWEQGFSSMTSPQ